MCLYVHFNDKHTPNKPVYKVVFQYGSEYRTPYLDALCELNKEFVAKGKLEQDYYCTIITIGAIHCFKSLDDAVFAAQDIILSYKPTRTAILECEVKEEDFIAGGVDSVFNFDSVCYKKVLPKKVVKIVE